jgi:hypothetical protein
MTPSVKAAQAANNSAGMYENFKGQRDSSRLTAHEREFIAARDSFYMATISETGWPYIQHRGGPSGFLRVLDDKTVACADFRGNRQYISVGNLAANDRACLFLMDYPHRARLKMYVRVEMRGVSEDPDLMAGVALPGYRGKVERALVFHLEAFDWNCPQHITPRFTETELTDALASVHEHIRQLETENTALKKELERRREASTRL